MKRTFIAIKINPQQPLLNLISELKEKLKGENLKWVEEYNLHLTLHFIGETTAEQVKAVANLLRFASREKYAFTLKFSETGYFGVRNQPRVLLVHTEKNEELELLVKEIGEGLAALGLPGNLKSYAPHLTLARIKQLQDQKNFHEAVARYKNQFLQITEVNEIIYYESILHPAEPVYKPIQVFKLK